MIWSSDLAYAVGLITTDGSLSIDGRHINLTSKNREQIETFADILHLNNKIGLKRSSFNPNGTYYQIQFGNIKFYEFLLKIGLTQNKTKTLSSLMIPDTYFADFLRGHLDGDGYTFSYWDKRWENSFMLYTGFISASKSHLDWLNEQIKNLYRIEGRIKYAGKSVYHLIFAKKGSICLSRKRFKIERALDIMTKCRGAEMVDRHA